jgi:hypothetical protein
MFNLRSNYFPNKDFKKNSLLSNFKSRCHNTTKNVITETMVIMKNIDGQVQDVEVQVEAQDIECLKQQKNIIIDKGKHLFRKCEFDFNVS